MVVAVYGAPPRGHALYQGAFLVRVFWVLDSDGGTRSPFHLVDRKRMGGGGIRMPQMLPVELGGIEGIACLADEFLVIRYLRAEGGKEVSYDGRIDADIQGLPYGFLAELGASAGKTEVSGRIDEAEQGDGDQHFFFA